MPAPTLEYATPDIDRQYRSLLPAAAFCGAIPLCAGIVDFIFFLLTESAIFVILGMYIIFGGLLLFGIGCIFVLVHVIINWHFLSRHEDRRRYRSALIRTSLLLVSNFPACAVILAIVSTMKTIKA